MFANFGNADWSFSATPTTTTTTSTATAGETCPSGQYFSFMSNSCVTQTVSTFVPEPVVVKTETEILADKTAAVTAAFEAAGTTQVDAVTGATVSIFDAFSESAAPVTTAAGLGFATEGGADPFAAFSGASAFNFFGRRL